MGRFYELLPLVSQCVISLMCTISRIATTYRWPRRVKDGHYVIGYK